MSTIRCLNVDLEIESRADLTPLIEELGDDVHVLHHGPVRGVNHAAVEVASGFNGEADDTIKMLYVLIRELPPDARAIWDGCCTKVFDVGYEAEATGQTYRSEIREGTIRNVAEIGARIVITIYPSTAVVGGKSNRVAER